MNKLKLIIVFLVSLLIFTNCKKDDDDDDTQIDNPNIIGTWKRISKATITGGDSTFTTYSETIYHIYDSNGNYTESKSVSGQLSSEAHYEYSLTNDSLKFYSMGVFSHAYPIQLGLTKMIIDIGTDGNTKYSYIPTKQ